MTLLTVDEFVPPEPNSWSSGHPGGWDTANHEAAHSVVAVRLGLTVREARIDHPVYEALGWTWVEFDAEKLVEHLTVTMSGLLAVGRAITWPLLASNGGDEQACALLVDQLGFGEEEWDLAHTVARKVLKDARWALTALSGALLAEGALRGDRVEQIVFEHLEGTAAYQS